ncbi:MAG: SLC13/DASS family transporter [Sulfurospirillum sp.]|nr:SLC13/DASS family transporter [Sulfurospirillum sp.]MBL0702865.1 SLC13/DASS family transporter [Sulfurospirillum sp.]
MFKKIIIALFVGIVFFCIALFVFTTVQAKLVGVIAFLVVFWTNEGLPLGAVSLLPIILFPSLGILSTNATSANYSQSIIFLFLGGFMIAIAVEKSGLHKVIANKIISLFPSTIRGIIFALSITSGVLSSFLSNTTTTLLLMPLALFLTNNINIKMRFVLAIAYGASVGGIMTPIGTPPNLILMGILEQSGLQSIAFASWFGMVAPLALIMFIVVPFVLSIGAENIKITRDESIKAMNSDQKKVMYALLGLIVILFTNAPIEPYYSGFGLNEKGLLLGFGLMMFAPPFNILKWEDSKKIPYEIIFLFGAGFSIAAAFTATGLSQSIANYLLDITSLPPFILLLVIASLITFTTEITSNTALISMMLPVLYAVTKTANLDPVLFMMVATICSSYAFMLPIATPPNAIAMSSGAVNIKDMMRYGVVFNLVGIFLISVISHFFW